jgi:hypothetical protein
MITEEEKPQPNKIPYRIVKGHNLGEDYAEGPRIKVRCTTPVGLYYDFYRRREGDVFILYPKWVTVTDKDTGRPVKDKDGKIKKKLVTAREQFSVETMEIVEEDEPENISTAQTAINKESEQIKEEKRSVRA